MRTLDLPDFCAFFNACHGVHPFDWQRELAGKLLGTGAWPKVLKLPTAAGKTAVLDIALFALAAQAGRAPSERTAPRRIVFVVDRRVVVDSTGERAALMMRRLEAARDGILAEVRESLLAFGGEQPLRCAVLRGGMPRDERWARTPLQPTVLVSTVDQVGSRILHRGYGVSPFAWPIHAGLLANDALIVLDEAHLSRPFEDTLARIAKYRTWAEHPLRLPFAVVRMSATPGQEVDVFPGEPGLVANDDRLRPRLIAPKPTSLDSAATKREESFVAACVKHARRFAGTIGGTVAVVVNRVGTARAIWRELDEAIRSGKEKLDAEVILLTGRSRPIERDALLDGCKDRLMAGPTRRAAAPSHPLIVVATQCIEAGADLDFDAMVTECCPLDSLRQRLGRLNRIGSLAEAPAAVIARRETIEGKGEDPIYGAAVLNTWQWLEKHAKGLDLSVAAVERVLPDDVSGLNAPTAPGPLIFPVYCDLWAQTSPEAVPSPDPAVFLHGPHRGEPEVQLVWRADLDPEHPAMWGDTVALCPPVAAETLSLRLSVARAWVARSKRVPDESDVPQGVGDEDHEATADRPFLRWLGPDDTGAPTTDPMLIRPGDTLIVPCSYGGCDRFGWTPDSPDTVADLAGQARYAAKRPPTLRLHPGLADSWKTAAGILQPLLEIPAEAEDCGERIGEALQSIAASPPAGAPVWLTRTCLELAGDRRRAVIRVSGGWVVLARRRWSEEAADFADDGVDSGAASSSVTLADHSAQVERLARDFAVRCGLPEPLIAAIALAARYHDVGKVDPRFQALLFGGDGVAALREARTAGGPLAKSARVHRSPAGVAESRRRSGYPEGGRHELLSVRLLECMTGETEPSEDSDLVRHLIASHHGRCRPFAPVVLDREPRKVRLEWKGLSVTVDSATGLERLDSGVADRFWNLVRRHGWWGLSYLEALLRLADHRASEKPEAGKEEA